MVSNRARHTILFQQQHEPVIHSSRISVTDAFFESRNSRGLQRINETMPASCQQSQHIIGQVSQLGEIVRECEFHHLAKAQTDLQLTVEQILQNEMTDNIELSEVISFDLHKIIEERQLLTKDELE